MVIIKKILVAIDFGEPSGLALAYGRDLARSYGAQLHAIHVVGDLVARLPPESIMALPDVQKDIERTARQDLDKLLTEDDRTTLRAVAVVDTSVNIAEGICRYATANMIDLIVTGTHGRGAVAHFLMGSVAERVVRLAGCPVLTVHNHERDFIVPDATSLAV